VEDHIRDRRLCHRSSIWSADGEDVTRSNRTRTVVGMQYISSRNFAVIAVCLNRPLHVHQTVHNGLVPGCPSREAEVRYQAAKVRQ
jgi:hypothetical protein